MYTYKINFIHTNENVVVHTYIYFICAYIYIYICTTYTFHFHIYSLLLINFIIIYYTYTLQNKLIRICTYTDTLLRTYRSNINYSSVESLLEIHEST